MEALDKAAVSYEHFKADPDETPSKNWQEYYRDLMFSNNLILSCTNNNISVNNIPSELKAIEGKMFTVLLGETIDNPGWNFYGQSPELLLFFIDKIKDHIKGSSPLVLLPSDHKLCIIFESKNNSISEVVQLCEYINRTCREFAFPIMKFSYNDSNDNILILPQIYREIDAAMKYHFFTGDSLVINSEWLSKKKGSMPANIPEKIASIIDSLYECFKENKRSLLEQELGRIQSIGQGAYSFNLYYFIWNQLYFLYQNESRTNNQAIAESPIAYAANNFNTADEAFKYVSIHILNLYDRIAENKMNSGSSQLDMVKSFLSEHISENYKMTDIAGLFNFSPSYFSHLFKSEYGESFSTYNNRFRIEEAKKLIEKNTGIQEAAVMVGIADSKYFSKLFRQFTGMSPMDYKKKAAEKNHPEINKRRNLNGTLEVKTDVSRKA